MKDGPAISRIAALVGDPARSNMLQALMDGRALTAGELAAEAGVTASTASEHLAKLAGAGLVEGAKQGRHRYFRLAAPDVAEMLEALMGVAERTGARRARPGPRDPALRTARTCYDHLAGAHGVALFEGLRRTGVLAQTGAQPQVTTAGRDFLVRNGVALEDLERGRRPLCLPCLDWSERRTHLGGALGAALFERLCETGALARGPGRLVVVRGGPGELAALLAVSR